MGGTGSAVWQAAEAMLQMMKLPAYMSMLHGRKVLELGAGTGINSIAAAMSNATVVATDKDPDSLVLVQSNIQANQHLLPRYFPCLYIFHLYKLNIIFCSRHHVAVRTLAWGNQENIQAIKDEFGLFDVILGSDLLFEALHGELLVTIYELCAMQGVVILTHSPRDYRREQSLLDTIKLQDAFDVVTTATKYLSRDSTVLVLEAGIAMVAASGGVDVSTEAAGTGLTRYGIPGQYTDVALTPDTAHSVGGSSSLNGTLYFVPPDSSAKVENELAETCCRNQRRVHRDPKVVYIYRHSIHRQQAVQYLQDAYIIHALALGSNGYKEAVSTNESRNAKAKTYVHPPFAIKYGLRHCPAKGRPNCRLVTSAVISHIRHIDGKAASAVSTLGDASMSASATLTPSVISPTSQLGLVGGKKHFPGVATNQSSRVTPIKGEFVSAWVAKSKFGTNHYGGSCYASGDATDMSQCVEASIKVVGTVQRECRRC
ncbi:hypothetical protein DYB37_000865 [Aphanomyces astaci]|uniref:Methyltransferase domain-containing protein n=1 Tax=Aphanomyces astaci TaxID=112090 RepID=A0A418FKZ6_APHAT|nr:hypothetical protein DYB37_000865 [Aphanomyces astaci]